MAYFSYDQQAYILALHEITGANTSQGVDLYKEKFDPYISRITLRRHWKRAGLESQGHGGVRVGSSEEEFRESWVRHDGDVHGISSDLNICLEWTVYRCQKLRLKPENSKGVFVGKGKRSARDREGSAGLWI